MVQRWQGCCLTIHSSRNRFAVRLNSGVRPALIDLRKPSQDTLILVVLLVVGLAATVLERGAADGFKITGGVIYAVCIMKLGFATWRSFNQRQLRLTLAEWCVALYAAMYALVSLAVGWPFGFLTLLGLIVPVFTLLVFSVFARFGWW